MDSKVYSEVYSILNMLGDQYISKLPQDIIDLIESNKEDEYIKVYSIDTIKNENINEEALELISYFNIEYWNNDIDIDDIITILPE